MKVLHFQHNGVGVILAEAQRGLGVESRVLATAPHPFGFREDFLLPHRRGPARILRVLDWRRYFDYDVFHCHDERVPRTARRHWAGSIVQHYHDPKTTGPVEGADMSFVSLPGILHAIPDGIWIPLPARSRTFTPELRSPHDKVRIGFSAQTLDPTKSPLIPMAEILSAVERSGGTAEAAPIEGVADHADMPAYYAGIDIWVDRIGCGFYGFATVEAAAMGLPVVTEIGAFEAAFVPGCPFVSTDRAGVTDALLSLIGDEAARKELGDASRTFAVAVHDADLVAARCLEEYDRLLKGN
jgi:hypothetical protein